MWPAIQFVSLGLLALSQCDLSICDAAAPGTSLRVEPAEVQIAGNLDRVQFAVTVENDSGRRIDVTARATYEVLTPALARVSTSGRITPIESGTGVVRVTYETETVDVPLVESGSTFNMFDDQVDEGFLVLRGDEQPVVLDADAVGFRFSRRPYEHANSEHQTENQR